MTFPTPNATDLQDVERIFNWINNTATGGLFMPVILLVIWLVAFVGVIAQGRATYRAWIFSNFICLTLSTILGLLGWLQISYIYFFIILLGLGMVWIKLQKPRRGL